MAARNTVGTRTIPSQCEAGEVLAPHTGNKNERRIGRKGLAIVEQMASEGQSDTAIAKTLRMDRRTLMEHRRRHPEVQEALDRGRATLEFEVTSLLLAKARKGDTIAMIFLAKARCGWIEGQVPGEQSRINVTINLPPAMSPDAYRRAIDITPSHASAD